MDEGNNSGVTGVIDLPGQGAKFSVWARGHTTELTAALMDAAGRGDSEWPEQRPLSSGGFVSVGGSVSLDGWPTPDKFRGELGTLTLQQQTGVTLALPVRVREVTFKKSSKEQGLWDVTAVCQIVGDPVSAGFAGSQPVAATETFDDKALWAGMTKTVDPQGLQSAATARMLVWGTGDDDAAEKTKIDDVLGAMSAPFSGMKIRAGAFQRLSKNACLVDVSFGLNDTADDVTMPATVTAPDVSELASEASVCLLGGSSALPSTPAAPVGLLVGTDSVQLNPGKWRHTFHYANTTPAQRVLFADSPRAVDPDALEDEQRFAVTADTATPPDEPPATPAGLKLRRRTAVRLAGTPEKWEHTYVFARTTTAEDYVNAHSESVTDLGGGVPFGAVVSRETRAAVNGTPALTVGYLIERERKTRTLNDGSVVTEITWGMSSVEQDVTLPRTRTNDTPVGLAQTATVAKFTDSATPPSAPTAPLGQHVQTTTEQINDKRWVHTFHYANSTAQELIEFPGTAAESDPEGLEGEPTVTQVTDSSTPPATPAVAGFQCRLVTSVREGGVPEKWRHAWRYGLRSTRDDVEMGGTHLLSDVSGLVDADTVVTVTSGASWTPPTNSASLVLRDYDRKQEVPGVYRYEASYGLWTRGAELVARSSRTTAPAARGRVDLDAVLASGTAAASVNVGGTVTASIDPTASIETAAEAVRTALLGDASFEAVDVERVTPSKLLLNLHRRGTRWWMELESHTFTGLLAPWRLVSGGVVQVFVADVVKVTSSLWAYVIGEVPAACTIMDFTIWKTYTGDSLYTNANAAGLTNADLFMGFAALTVTYAGVTGPVAIKDTYRYPSATNLSAVAFEGARTQGWKFRFDSRGIVAADGICPGYVAYTTTDLSGVSPRSWVNASTLGISAASATPLDFTQAFLNTTP